MRLRLTRTAGRQLDQVLRNIGRHHPPGAQKVQTRIRAAMHLLLHHPYAGQATGRPGIRRMVVSGHPYILTYRVSADEIVIRSVRHAARRPEA